jgi:hypothetical protein
MAWKWCGRAPGQPSTAARHLGQAGVDPDQVTQAVISCWQDGEVTGPQVDDLSFEEAARSGDRR